MGRVVNKTKVSAGLGGQLEVVVALAGEVINGGPVRGAFVQAIESPYFFLQNRHIFLQFSAAFFQSFILLGQSLLVSC